MAVLDIFGPRLVEVLRDLATVRLAADTSDAAVVPLLGDADALVSGRFSERMAQADDRVPLLDHLQSQCGRCAMAGLEKNRALRAALQLDLRRPGAVLHDLEVALHHVGADLEWVRPIPASRNHPDLV